jgi:hypothetical protein
MRLACRLRELRRERGLSLRELQESLRPARDRGVKISRTDLSKVELGRLLPKDDWVPALEAAYGAPESSWYVPPAGAVAGVAIERDARAGEGRRL